VLKVVVWGLFPTVFMTRCKAVCNPAGVAGLRTYAQQLAEYPPHVHANISAAGEAIWRFSRFWPAVGFEVVSATSLRGIAYSLKYRLREGVYAIFMGRVFSLPSGLETLINAIERQLYPPNRPS
jgi:hypothetical protein